MAIPKKEKRVPKELNTDDQFLYEIKDMSYTQGSHVGFVLGEVSTLKDLVANGEIEKLKSELDMFYDLLSSYCSESNSLQMKISDEWVRKGRPVPYTIEYVWGAGGYDD